MVMTKKKQKVYDSVSKLKAVSCASEVPVHTAPYATENKGATHE